MFHFIFWIRSFHNRCWKYIELCAVEEDGRVVVNEVTKFKSTEAVQHKACPFFYVVYSS